MTQPVSRGQFNETIDKWMDAVRREALKLYDDDIPAEHCMPIALKIVEARDVGAARDRLEMLGGAGLGLRRRPS